MLVSKRSSKLLYQLVALKAGPGVTARRNNRQFLNPRVNVSISVGTIKGT